MEGAERAVVGRAWLDTLVLAILLGAVLRTVRPPGPRLQPGIAFAAKPVLEVAIVLLGFTLDVPLLLRSSPLLILTILVAVGTALVAGYWLGRVFGLGPKLAALVATGNAICGNSAIAAVAPVIDAPPEDVASAISFTAVLGVVVVLFLPLLVGLLALTPYQYGVVAGLTVYAVPQVLAATLPVHPLAGDVGTLVKLTRVLMLGPVILGLSAWARRGGHARSHPPGEPQARPRKRLPSLGAVLPAFVVGFLVAAAVRATGIVPADLVGAARETSRWLTVVALAALGLGVDVRMLRRAGPPVLATAAGALLLLLAISVLLARTIA